MYCLRPCRQNHAEKIHAAPAAAKERRLFRKALGLLDQDEKHPSLRVHRLHGDQQGSWSASASDDLRMTFERQPGGRKRMLTCSRHYGD